MTDYVSTFSDGQVLEADDMNKIRAARTGDLLPIDDSTSNYTDDSGAIGSSTIKFSDADVTSYLKVKVIDLGDWDMDTTPSIDVTTGITYSNIKMAQVIIRADTGKDNDRQTDLVVRGGEILWLDTVATTDMQITRTNGSLYDTTNYNTTSFNRGWLTIWYQA